MSDLVIKIVILLAALLYSATAGDRKCRALTMSGGGDKGAYEAAVFLGFVNNLPAEDVSYDVINGVSAGSLNTIGLSGFEPSDVIGASEFIYALWNTIPNYQAFANWPGGIMEGIFEKQGIFDNSPGVKFLEDQIKDNTVKRKVSFAAVDANAAEYFVMDYNASDVQPPDLIQSAIASSSLPGIFEPVHRGNRILIDGGTVWNMDLSTAVRRCREIVDDDRDIIVDIVLCGNYSPVEDDKLKSYTSLEHFLRGRDIDKYFNDMSDFNSTVVLYPNVNWRYLVAPSENLDENPFVSINFSQEQIDKCFNLGQKDAKNAVLLGPGGYRDVLLDFTQRIKSGEKVNLKSMIEQALKKSGVGVNSESS